MQVLAVRGWMRVRQVWLSALLSVLLAGALAAACASRGKQMVDAETAEYEAMRTAAPEVATTGAATLPRSRMAAPTDTPVAGVMKTSEQVPEVEGIVKLIVVYDNNAYTESVVAGLRTDWGFACWVETGDSTVLFDTGGNGAILMNNLNRLGLDPAAIDAVVLSHAHGDHTGGLTALLDAGVRPAVYLLDTFPAGFKQAVRNRTALVEISGPAEVVPGVHTTGRVDGEIPEEALIVESSDGLLVITGCAHPGVVNMVRRAREAVEGEVALVVGGYHLGSASQAEIRKVAEGLAALGVQRVAPCHCSGDLARAIFSEGWGAECLLPGVGWDYLIEPEG